MLVVRTAKSGSKLMMAKPCENCIKKTNQIVKDKGYRLQNIYYTNEVGEIVKL